MIRPTRDIWAMELAMVTARRSTCCRRSVGCILLNADSHVLATGYNGVAMGMPHCNEIVLVGIDFVDISTPGQKREAVKVTMPQRMVETQPLACPGAASASGTNLEGCEAIHAEQNALLQCHDVRMIETVYTTTAPCLVCTKLLLNTGCRRIVYQEDYPQAAAAWDLWTRAGRTWLRLI